MKIQAGLPAGVTAQLFGSARERRHLESRLAERLESQGFSEVLLPILDYFDPYGPLLSEASRERLYRFVDRDGHLLALRGDFTPMLARLLAPRADSLELPSRLFYRGDVVRYQEVRPGRLREYSQLGVEILDHPDASHDEEILSLFVELIAAELAASAAREEDVELKIVVGLAGALDELIRSVGGGAEMVSAVARRDRQLTRTRSSPLVEIVEQGLPRDLAALGQVAPWVEEIAALCRRLEESYRSLGVGVMVDLAEFASHTLDPRLLGGSLERSYYDGVVFCAYLARDAQPIGNGGRYDGLFAALGADLGATGFSLGLDRLLEHRRTQQPAGVGRGG